MKDVDEHRPHQQEERQTTGHHPEAEQRASIDPAIWHRARPGLPAQTGLAIVSWLMRVAGIGLSPLVGLLATSMPLTPALLVFPVLAALGVLCSLVLHRAGHR